jgi:hypothetical protein
VARSDQKLFYAINPGVYGYNAVRYRAFLWLDLAIIALFWLVFMGLIIFISYFNKLRVYGLLWPVREIFFGLVSY